MIQKRVSVRSKHLKTYLTVSLFNFDLVAAIVAAALIAAP